MTKTALRRGLLWATVTAICVFVALSLAGRSVGSHPLPWHVAWLAPLGDRGWRCAFKLSLRTGWSEAEVRERVGEPLEISADNQVLHGGKTRAPGGGNEKLWFYASPHHPPSGTVLLFRDGTLADY